MYTYNKTIILILMIVSFPCWSLVDTPVVFEHTDSQIVKIMIEANQDTLVISKIAKNKSELINIRAFASDMIEFHSKNMEDFQALSKAEKILPKASGTATKLKLKKYIAIANFKPRTGYSFDKSYIKNQVKFHRSLLIYLNTKLIPQAKNKNLKFLLENTKENILIHLEKAEKIEQLFTI